VTPRRPAALPALLYLGELELAQGNLAPAATYFAEAHAIASGAGNRFNQVHAAKNRGIVAHLQGDYVQAQALLDHSLSLAREVERGVLPYILFELGLVAHAQGQISRAIALLRDTLSGLRDRNLPGGMINALEALAGALAAGGKAEHAARLLGAAEALREVFNVRRHMHRWPDYERDVAATRSQLDDATFVAAWSAGRALMFEEAIGEALAVSGSSERQQVD
jgi:tetratricopeptide (TPR) repeat protein